MRNAKKNRTSCQKRSPVLPNFQIFQKVVTLNAWDWFWPYAPRFWPQTCFCTRSCYSFDDAADVKCKENLDAAVAMDATNAEAHQLTASYWLSKSDKGVNLWNSWIPHEFVRTIWNSLIFLLRKIFFLNLKLFDNLECQRKYWKGCNVMVATDERSREIWRSRTWSSWGTCTLMLFIRDLRSLY